ncbi:uncharacterized protein LOC109841264 [Asparagus officinalis]|uniref:uncharacterized protein LOC109841264 n=1 Tax=Asparagus officinalis TaxID=4686 RepID=UPI00098DFEA4|nr:uncharacterized protein LOC109841264 [Asparagus officinalis]
MTKTRERMRRVQKEKGRVLKALISKSTGKTAGRNSSGRITSFHRGGGSKRLQRTVDLKRNTPATGVVERIEYDPNRSSRVALVRWIDGVNLLRRGQRKADDDLSPSAGSKVLESPISSVFSFSTLPGGVDQKQGSSSRSSLQPKCLPKNYVAIGEETVRASPFSSSPLDAEGENPTVLPSSLGFRFPRIAVAGARPAFFAPRAAGEEDIGENLTLDEIWRWKTRSIDRKVALSWQSSGFVESRPKLEQSNLLPTQVLSYALSNGRSLYQNAAPVKPKVGKGPKEGCVPVSYIIASDHLEPGKTVVNCDLPKPLQSKKLLKADQGADMQKKLQEISYERLDLSLQVGNCIPLTDIRMGSWVHDIELRPGQGAKLARSAGTYAKVIKEQDAQCLIRMPSGVEKWVDSRCRATIGIVSNPEHGARKLKKAGQSRWLGRRPVVRGVAMNPVDHPHGGGEGRTKGGRPSVSPWGKPTKGGFKTVLKVASKGKL